MKSFKEHKEEQKLSDDIYDLIEFMECDLETLSEAIDFKSAIKGANLNLKTNKGLIAALIRTGKDISLLFWHSLKVLGGNEESRKKVKELAQKKVSKEDFMNFLINLDMITFHAISGPIHIIDAITGWDLHHRIISTHDKIKEIQATVANHLDSIQASTSGLTKKIRKKAIVFIKRLRKTFKSFKEIEAV